MPTNFVKTTLIDINPNSVNAEAVQSIQSLLPMVTVPDADCRDEPTRGDVL